MSNTTKKALEASLKRLMLEKPFEKITINDLTRDCGISRMTFYNHFRDIYDLVEWSCEEDGKQALRDNRTYDTWQEGLLLIFKAVLANKPFILSVYRSVSREQIETYLFGLTCELIENVVEEKSVGRNVSAEEKRFIAEVYKYSFVGIMLDWVKQGMKERPEVLVDKLGTALCGSVENSVGNFERKKRGQKRE